LTSRLPSPAYLTALPAHLPNQAHSTVADQRSAARFVSRRGTRMPVPQRRETTAQSQRAGRIVRPPSSRRFVGSSRASVIVVSHLALSIQLGRGGVTQLNLRESPEMRFGSTALVMMTIALMLLALMLLGPTNAKSDDLRSELNNSGDLRSQLCDLSRSRACRRGGDSRAVALEPVT
jgi:hypothetical protein